MRVSGFIPSGFAALTHLPLKNKGRLLRDVEGAVPYKVPRHVPLPVGASAFDGPLLDNCQPSGSGNRSGNPLFQIPGKIGPNY